MLKLAAVLAPAVLAVGCANQAQKPYDYSAFEASSPRSILVLPPVNNSPDVQATNSMYSSMTYPLAEAGYYVMPVSLVNETFKQNGLTSAADIHNVDTQKLHQIFGADAALYMTVNQFGSSYNLVSSVITIGAKAKLVDLKTQALLWEGEVTVVDNGNQGGNTPGGLAGLLIKAVVTQIMNSSLNRSHEVAARANAMLLSGGQARGVLYGPRSPNFKGRERGMPVASNEPAPRLVAAAPAAPVAVVPQPVAVAATPVAAAPQPVVVAAQPVAVAPQQVAVAPQPVAAPVAPVAAAPAYAPAYAPATLPPAAPLNAEQQRYAEVLAKVKSKHQALDPSSAWYRQELFDWVMDRKEEFIRAGKSPEIALQQAVTAMERN
ncbi:DUF799 domain-containing protein [Massilia sp. SR12]